jgi:hypothetical protein
LHNPPANGKQRPISEEMLQTLLTNKKQGKLDSPSFIKPMIKPQEIHFLRYKIIGTPKIFKLFASAF